MTCQAFPFKRKFYIELDCDYLLVNKAIIIIIIVTLFQEDNIFGMYVSLTYGPQLQR